MEILIKYIIYFVHHFKSSGITKTQITKGGTYHFKKNTIGLDLANINIVIILYNYSIILKYNINIVNIASLVD